MAIEYPGLIPDLLVRFGLNPLSFANYQDLLRELQALFNTAGTNPQGTGGTIDGRLDAIETILNQPALAVIVSDGTPVVNTTTETPFSNGSYTIAANSATVGRTYRLTAGGIASTAVSGPGTLTFRVRWGNTTGAPLLAEFTSVTLNTSISNLGWGIQALVTIRTLGSSAGSSGIGLVEWGSLATSGGYGAGIPTINTTVATPLTLFAKWSVASASNTITLRSFIVEQIN